MEPSQEFCASVTRAREDALGGMTRGGGGAQSFQPGEQLCAFLDDEHANRDPERVKAMHDTLAECLWRVPGTQPHQERTKVWNKGRVPPHNMD